MTSNRIDGASDRGSGAARPPRSSTNRPSGPRPGARPIQHQDRAFRPRVTFSRQWPGCLRPVACVEGVSALGDLGQPSSTGLQSLGCVDSATQNGHVVIFTHGQLLGAVQLDLAADVFPEQDLVAQLQVRRPRLIIGRIPPAPPAGTSPRTGLSAAVSWVTMPPSGMCSSSTRLTTTQSHKVLESQTF